MSVGDRAAEGQLVGVFEVVAEAHAAGDGRDLHGVLRNLFVEVVGGGLPFHAGTQGHHHFRDAAAFAILIIILLFKPQGLMGKNIREKV